MLKLSCRKEEASLDAINTHISDEEDETAGEENGSASDGKRQEEASRVVHEGSDHRPNCEAKVE